MFVNQSWQSTSRKIAKERKKAVNCCEPIYYHIVYIFEAVCFCSLCVCAWEVCNWKKKGGKCWDKKWWNLTRCHNAIACIFNKTFQSVCMSSITTILFLKWLYNGKIALWHWSMTSSGKCTFFESTLVANANDEKKNMLEIVKKKHTQKFIHELIKRKMTQLWHSKNNFLIQMFIKKEFRNKKRASSCENIAASY